MLCFLLNDQTYTRHKLLLDTKSSSPNKVSKKCLSVSERQKKHKISREKPHRRALPLIKNIKETIEFKLKNHSKFEWFFSLNKFLLIVTKYLIQAITNVFPSHLFILFQGWLFKFYFFCFIVPISHPNV